MQVCLRAFNETDFEDLFDYVAGATNSTHVVARLEGRVVGHAVWSTRKLFLKDGRELRTAYLDAVATDPDLQGRGIGSAVIQRVNHEIHQFDIGCLSTERVSFYEHNGWELWTGLKGVKTDQGVRLTPDVNVMVRRTARTPTLDKAGLLVIQTRRHDPW